MEIGRSRPGGRCKGSYWFLGSYEARWDTAIHILLPSGSKYYQHEINPRRIGKEE